MNDKPPRPRHRYLSLSEALGRHNRDGSKTMMINFYPTEIELAKLRALAKARQLFNATLITTLIEEARVGTCWYSVKVSGHDAERLEYFAKQSGFPDGDAWLQATIDAALKAFAPERPPLASERRGG